MASRSESGQATQFRIQLPRPRHRTSPYPPTSVHSHLTKGASVAVQAALGTGVRLSGTATNTSVQAILTALLSALGELVANLGAIPLLQSTVRGLQDCFTHIRLREQTINEYEVTVMDVTSLANALKTHVVESNSRNVSYSIANTARCEQTKPIKEYQTRLWMSQLAEGYDEEDFLLQHYRRIGELSQVLQVDVSSSIWDEEQGQRMVGTQNFIGLGTDESARDSQDNRLKELLPVHEAYYNAALPRTATKRVECTENTRVDLLEGAWKWTQDEDGAEIYWLNGMAGTGKTTIAYTMCKMLQDHKRLGACFFCSRNSPDCRDVNKIIPTIAYQLGRYSNPYRQRLCDILNGDPDVARRDVNTQFNHLIFNPLTMIGGAMPSNVVVVIDALDECTDLGGTKDVLGMLLRHAENLPLKFFVASRPEPDISNYMTSSDGGIRSILWLHDIDRLHVQADIKTYLIKALQSIQITPSEIDALAERAGCLFIFAATAVRYIIPDRPSVNHRQRLLTVLKLLPTRGNKIHKEIDDLYATILSNALDEDIFEEEELAQRRQLLWSVVCVREALTKSALAELLGMPDAQAVELAIQLLQSVLRVSEETHVISTFHASFPDFILNQERAGRFHCDEILQSVYLAKCCFQLMSRSLRFNICGLESSYTLDRDVPNFKYRVDNAISTGLFYACRYWGDHLAKCPSSPSLMLLLKLFLEHFLLFWVEVLNLKRQVSHADGALGQAQAWLLADSNPTDLQNFIDNARIFIITFASTPISLSTPHIYASAVPFTSKKNRVWTTYWPRLQGVIRVEGAAIEARGRSALATWVVGNAVNCIAQSGDGKRIVSGSGAWFSSRGEVSVWDAFSGTRTIGPLEAHGGQICSVVFSPDDTRIASGSADRTIRIWDADKGQPITGPLRGHTDNVWSLAFSPDGSCLASSSHDKTVRLWNARLGTSLGGPLEGYAGGVWSVAFSPDGNSLACGSYDHKLRIWDLQTRRICREPFEGHTQAVRSIMYSSDGQRLVSGSEDCTVRVWDAVNGTLISGPFTGHTDAVISVSFSPGATQVASGSRDGTIRVWDVEGTLLVGPPKGHIDGIKSVIFTAHGARVLSGSKDGTIRVWDARHSTADNSELLWRPGMIHSVALSPDGTRVASGSNKSRICIWDTYNGALVAGPFEGHADQVESVAFSSDGGRIVSGSRDCTLRTWDASTGTLLSGPFEGHTKSVMSVTFSPGGSRIASGSHDGTVRIWNSYTGTSLAEPFTSRAAVTSVAFSPDGIRLVSGSHSSSTYDPTILLCDANSSALLWASCDYTKPINCVAFSPDGTQVVAGSNDGGILVLNACNGMVLHGPFRISIETVLSVTFSPDGSRVLSGSQDGTLCVWDVRSGTHVGGPLKGGISGITSLALFPDGLRMISGSTDGTIRLWDLEAAIQLNPISSQTWFINEHGWLTNSKSELLLWVPLDLRKKFALPSLCNPGIISGDCSSFIDNSTLLLGDQWHKCFTSPVPVV